MGAQTGGCLCRAIKFEVFGEPEWVTICTCQFCQRATGSAYMVEPMFRMEALRLTEGEPCVYTHVSEGSGRDVRIHFCSRCSGKLYLTFQRWPEELGVYAGAFDDPNWFRIAPDNSKYIFSAEAQRGTVFPPGFRIFTQHAVTLDGQPLEPVVLTEALCVSRRGTDKASVLIEAS